MVTKVRKWGNSQGLRLARQILDEAHIAVGDAVEVSVKDNTIMITPVNPVRGSRDLQELVARIPKDYAAIQEDWGSTVGREIW